VPWLPGQLLGTLARDGGTGVWYDIPIVLALAYRSVALAVASPSSSPGT
jgi:hypothetical protein